MSDQVTGQQVVCYDRCKKAKKGLKREYHKAW